MMAVGRFSNHLCVLESSEQEGQAFSHDVVIVCKNDSRLAHLAVTAGMTDVRRLRCGNRTPFTCNMSSDRYGDVPRILRKNSGCVPLFSEQQLQRELDLTRGRGGRCNDPAQGAVLGALENNLIRVRQIGMIQNIERLGTELQIQPLADSHSL